MLSFLGSKFVHRSYPHVIFSWVVCHPQILPSRYLFLGHGLSWDPTLSCILVWVADCSDTSPLNVLPWVMNPTRKILHCRRFYPLSLPFFLGRESYMIDSSRSLILPVVFTFLFGSWILHDRFSIVVEFYPSSLSYHVIINPTFCHHDIINHIFSITLTPTSLRNLYWHRYPSTSHRYSTTFIHYD